MYFAFTLYVYIQMCMHACPHAYTHTHTHTLHGTVQKNENDENSNFVLNWKGSLQEYLDLPMFIFIGNMYCLYVGSRLLLH